MPYKFQNELIRMSEVFIHSLRDDAGISAEIIQDSFRDYAVKLSIARDGEDFGSVSLYYSPRRNAFSLSTRELMDSSITLELERAWQQLNKPSRDIHTEGYQIYVDGSYLNGSTGYGVVILRDGQVIEELSGIVPPEFVYGTYQIAGELFAAREAIEWCQRNSVPEASILHDYEGVGKWATGEWKTKQSLTRRYAEFTRSSGIRIDWHKVDSHTGNRWNDRADELAKKAAGSSTDSQANSNPELEARVKEFAGFLADRGYKAELKGIYGDSNCAKIEVSHGSEDIGYINIYCTKEVPLLPRYHEIREESHGHKLDLLWREFYYGERELFPVENLKYCHRRDK